MRKIIYLLVFCFAFFSASAQDSKGTDFWIGFPVNHNGTNFISVYLVSDVNTSATVSASGISFNQVVALTAGVVTTVSIPTTIEPSAFTIQDRGVHITANDEISVFGLNAQQATTDAYLGFPTDALGTSYYMMSYEANLGIPAGGLVVATQNNTTVTITPSFTNGGWTSGVSQNITLDQGEVYYMQSGGNGSDMSGTKVESDKPVAVFSGNECVQVPTGKTYCDHIVSQIQPNSSWGLTFYTAPLSTRLNGDRFRIMAQENVTNVDINGVNVATLNAGEFYETVLSGGNVVEGDEPLLVAQYSHSTQYDGVLSDPFMLIVPPSDQYLPNYTVSTVDMLFNPASQVNFLNIISPNGNTGNVQVNGVNVAAWTAIGASGHSFAQVPVSNGQHSITSTLPIGLYSYGFSSVESYGYVGGQSFSPVAAVNQVGLNLQQIAAFQAQEKCVEAEVLDQNNNPVVGVKVDFNVMGANNLTSFGFTNANGKVQFCYNVCLPGVDTVVATITGLKDTAFVNIQPTSLSVNPMNANVSQGTQQCVTATVLDGANLPVQNAVVNFDVSGANTLNQNVLTDASGNAVFCYTPANAGNDVIDVSAGCTGGNSAQVNVTVGANNNPCQSNIQISFTPYGLNKIWKNQGLNDPSTHYLGVTQWKRIRAKVTGGVGPFTYNWTNSEGYTIKPWGANPLRKNLFEPQTSSYMVLEVIDHGNNNCPTKDSILIAVDSSYWCGTPQNFWMLTVCQGGVTQCVPWGTAKNIIKNNLGTLGACTPKTASNLGDEAVIVPNPSNGFTSIYWPSKNVENASIEVTDIKGAVLYTDKVELSEGINYYHLNLPTLPDGMYLVRMISGNDVTVKKMIIER